MALNLLEMYSDCDKAIKELDKQLDSRDGGTSGLKSQIISDSIEATKNNWEVVSNSITSQLESTPVEVQIGFYYGLLRNLDKVYGPTAKKYIEEQLANAPKVEPLISDAQVPEVTEKRKEVYAQIKSIMEMAKAFGDPDAEQMVNPRRRGGAPKGKRGPRAISYFSWEIDGKDYASLKDVLEDLPVYDKVSDLTKAMKAAGFNLTTPPAEIVFELPDGRQLVGTNSVTDDTDDGDEEEETVDE